MSLDDTSVYLSSVQNVRYKGDSPNDNEFLPDYARMEISLKLFKELFEVKAASDPFYFYEVEFQKDPGSSYLYNAYITKTDRIRMIIRDEREADEWAARRNK